jgi:hypothetical protein
MRTYSVHVVRVDGTEITVRKRGHNETDALSRAVEKDYPKCKMAWVWLSYAAKAIHIGEGGVKAFRDSRGLL